jgi:hypothetical protein
MNKIVSTILYFSIGYILGKILSNLDKSVLNLKNEKEMDKIIVKLYHFPHNHISNECIYKKQ